MHERHTTMHPVPAYALHPLSGPHPAHRVWLIQLACEVLQHTGILHTRVLQRCQLTHVVKHTAGREGMGALRQKQHVHRITCKVKLTCGGGGHDATGMSPWSIVSYVLPLMHAWAWIVSGRASKRQASRQPSYYMQAGSSIPLLNVRQSLIAN